MHRSMQTHVRLLLGCITAAALWGCTTAPPSTDQATPLPLSAMRCTALAGLDVPADEIGLPTRGMRVTASTVVPAAPASGTTQAVTAYCRVLAEVLPVDPAAPAIRLQLNVPDGWRGGAIQVGGGGLNGSIPANLAALGGSGSPVSGAQPPDAPYPINRGYAMFGGDSGHQGTEGMWGLNAEARLNFAHAALKKTHDAAQALLRRLHGRAASPMYFMGQSQGGREALEVAQRYPADYDGVVATAPLIGYSAHVITKTLLAGLQTGDGWISPEQAKWIGTQVLQQCDALDGLADGVIANAQACRQRFNTAALACQPGSGRTSPPQCLNPAQLATWQRMHAPLDMGYPMANGWRVFPGYGLGREGEPGWLNITPQPRPGTPANLGQPGTSTQFVILKDPSADLLRLDLRASQSAIQAASPLIDSTNPDLRAFFARGGKLIVKSNAADYSVNPQTLAEWFERMRTTLGDDAVDRRTRFYVLPAAGHDGRGVHAATGAQAGEPIAHAVDLVSMMLDWVEHGTPPPDAPVLRAFAPGNATQVLSTRPLCRHPLYPHYQGGDVRDARSFTCTASPAHRENASMTTTPPLATSPAAPGRHIDLPGVKLWTVDTGGAGTPLVLLHANTGTSQAWAEQIPAFQQAGFRVIAFDRRGWGRSMAEPDTGPQPGSIATDLDALVQALGLDRFALLGIAGGGFAALDYASWRPERVAKLVIAGSNGQFTEPEMQAFYSRIAVPGLTGRIEVRPFLEVGVAYRSENPEGFARFIEMEHTSRQNGAPAQPLRTPNTFAKLATISMPTLVLMGGADLLAPPALMRTWSRHIPQAQHVEIGDAGHSINWERPAAFNRLVLDFLKGSPQ